MSKQKNSFLLGEGDAWLERNRLGLRSQPLPDLDFLCRYLQNSDLEIKRFLEIGCSSGIKTIELSERIGAIGYGIDPSNKAIEEAIQASAVAYQKNFFLPGTADILNFKESFFDLVFLGFVYT